MSLLDLLRRRNRTPAVEQEVDEELRFHLATRADELMRQGLSRERAEAQARREFGDVDAARRELAGMDHRRLARRGRATWWEELAQDLRVTLRMLRKQPGFTAVILLTIALGIGANAAIYTLVDAALVRPLPFREPERLLYLSETRESSTDRTEASYPDFLDWRAQAPSFEVIEGWDDTNVTISGDGGTEPVRSQGIRTTAGFLPMLGVTPLLGRTFADAEAGPGGAPVVILSEGFWRRRFGGDRQAIGRTLGIDGTARTIIGVLPAGFHFAPVGTAEVWFPLDRSAETRAQRFNHWLRVVGRLRPGATEEGARSELATVMQRLGAQYPESNAGRGIAVVPLRDMIVGDVRPTLLILLGAVVLVLLIACANVASLLLARALARGREMAVRAALGGGRGRLVRQLLTESLFLSAAGAVLGVGLGHFALRGLLGVVPESFRLSMPYLEQLSVNGRVLGYLAGIAIATGVGFGLVPALAATRPALASLLSGDRRATGGVARSGMRNALVTFEVALTVVLLVGAGLLTRSLTRLMDIDPGFDPSRSLTVRVALAGQAYEGPTARRRFFEDLLERARTIPGVERVGAVSSLPLNGGGTNSFHVDGLPEPDPARRPEAVTRGVAGDYFEATGIRLIDGRVFTARDDSTAPQAILINQSLARQLGPGQAVGKRFRFYAWADQPWTVVGVVADVKTNELDREIPPTVYYSHLQGNVNRMSLVARSALEPAALEAALRRAVFAIDPTLPVYAVRTMEEEITSSAAVRARRYPLTLLGGFAAVALVLAVVGIAGVINYSVSQRTREIGIRVALGARRSMILSLIVRQGVRLALTGVLIGVGFALLSTRWLSAVLYGVAPTDSATFLGVSAGLLAVAVAASLVPAARAARVDPAVTLRDEG